ncbi:MAG: anaerobic ribonucleoside triphosphate reductase [Abditibacteriota bacterium]|nr:anaerobic ribonucleoside triphosphate reductase [Abditibacteriota bacterium]
MIEYIVKRDGRKEAFDDYKIYDAMHSAYIASGSRDKKLTRWVVNRVVETLESRCGDSLPTVEMTQDVVEESLIKAGYVHTAKAYILYRDKRTHERERQSALMKTIHDITFQDAKDNDLKRENANINSDSSMGMMLKFGSETSKSFFLNSIAREDVSRAHRDGYIPIHDMDFAAIGTTTCTQIPIDKLFTRGFSTGNGYLREPQSINTAAALTAIIIQSNQNEQHGGQSIPLFDYYLAPYVARSYAKRICEVASILKPETDAAGLRKKLRAIYDEKGTLLGEKDSVFALLEELSIDKKTAEYIVGRAAALIKKDTYQAMEGLIHNLNTLSSRAGAQVPFSSINFGTDTTEEGRMVTENLLLATEAGMGYGETPIFPVSIFKVKSGINLNEGDPNHDLFRLACRCSAKRLFPNFSFIDAPFNLSFYKEGMPETEVGYMGCRTRVLADVNGDQVTPGRGNLSFTSINLPRLAIEADGDIDRFYESLDSYMELVVRQLLDRFVFQCKKRMKNFPFMIGQATWNHAEELVADDTLESVLKHGTLSIGFIGLAEALVALIGRHHGESAEAQALGLEIVRRMRAFCDAKTKEYSLNFTLLATPAEGLSGRFIRIDKKRFGEIKGVTDRDYYTNSFHVPVYYQISPFKKIDTEAPYHELTNAGHISYVEVDGDPLQNLEAFEAIIRHMAKKGIGYGSINHPVDRDPVCGYVGIINDVCPRCGRKEGEPLSPEKYAELKEIYHLK